jgi:NTP pyrophosphatase (non-canonical NTP hydrolase)
MQPHDLGLALRAVWCQARENHQRYSATGDLENDIRFFGLAIAGEAGELANFIKKRWRDGVAHDQALKLEAADIVVYCFMLADVMGVTAAELLQMIADKQQVFIEKMKALRETAPASAAGD